MRWLSFDLDWATGDCREYQISGCGCVKDCFGCRVTWRGNLSMGYFDYLDRFAVVREKILSLTIKKVIVRDSHGDVFAFLKTGDTVLNLDFHTDDYFPEDVQEKHELHCGNWVNFCDSFGIQVTQIEHPQDIPAGEYNLFVAISRPFTHEELDGELFRLLIDLQVKVDLYGGCIIIDKWL